MASVAATPRQGLIAAGAHRRRSARLYVHRAAAGITERTRHNLAREGEAMALARWRPPMTREHQLHQRRVSPGREELPQSIPVGGRLDWHATC